MSKQEKNALATTKAQDLMTVQITAQDITKYFCPLADEKEVFMALGIINSLQLNPHKREVHLIKYDKNSKLAIVVGYEVYLKRAERSGKLSGWSAGVDTVNKTAWVEIFRKDWDKPFRWEVSTDEFSKNQATWKTMPTFMAKKVAIAQGFRLAFPDELGGMPYTTDEAQVYDITGECVPDKPEIKEPKQKQIEAPATTEQAQEHVQEQPQESPAISSEPATREVLTITQAKAVKIGVSFCVSGMIASANVRTVNTKNGQSNITDYIISDDADASMKISIWGDPDQAAIQGTTAIFSNVSAMEYKGAKQYKAESIKITG